MHQHRILLLLILLGVTLLPPVIHGSLFAGPVWLPFALWIGAILISLLLNHSGERP